MSSETETTRVVNLEPSLRIGATNVSMVVKEKTEAVGVDLEGGITGLV